MGAAVAGRCVRVSLLLLQGELWCLFCAAEVSLPAQASFPCVVPWCWLWCVFLSLVARLCFHLRWFGLVWSFLFLFSFCVGKGCEVMPLGRAWGAPSWSEGLWVAAGACEEVALGVGTWALDALVDGAAPGAVWEADENGEERQEERLEGKGRGKREEFSCCCCWSCCCAGSLAVVPRERPCSRGLVVFSVPPWGPEVAGEQSRACPP